MIRGWFVFRTPRICGWIDGPHTIPARDPVRICGATVRCHAHTEAVIDWQAIDNLRMDLELEDLRRAAKTDPERVIGGDADDVAAPAPKPVTRHTPVRQPLPFHELRKHARRHPLPFDTRAAQTND